MSDQDSKLSGERASATCEYNQLSITAATYFCLNRFIFYMEMFNGWIIVPEKDSQTFYSSWTIPLGLGVWVHDKKKNQPFYERWVYQGQV